MGAPVYTQGPGPGGGGGVLTASSVVINRLAYIIIGAGGAGGTAHNPTEYFGKNGSNTIIYNGYGLFVETLGGGGSRQNGGSGGGGYGTDLPAGLGTLGQGNNGATGTGTTFGVSAGGGGGAGGAGIAATQTGGGTGGAGFTWTAGDSRIVGGGGGGWWFDNPNNFTSAAGGTGGGGRGAGNTPAFTLPLPGTANTGGGGGNGIDDPTLYGKNGGSGVVVIQYASATALARGGVISGVGSGTVRHTFNTSGVFIINSP